VNSKKLRENGEFKGTYAALDASEVLGQVIIDANNLELRITNFHCCRGKRAGSLELEALKGSRRGACKTSKNLVTVEFQVRWLGLPGPAVRRMKYIQRRNNTTAKLTNE